MASSPAHDPLPGSDDWQLESCRITVFLTKPLPSESRTWEAFVMEEPEVEVRSKSDPQSRYIAASPHDLGTITLRVDGTMTKVDWFVGSVRLHDSPPDDPIVGPLWENLPALEDFLRKWIRSSQDSVQRVGLGLVLLGPSHDEKPAAYRCLAPFLPSIVLDPASSDFAYQINRPRASSTANVVVNRLSTWSVVRMLDVSLESDGRSLRPRSEFRRRTAIDVNTSPEFEAEFDPEAQSPLLMELFEAALEIARTGDRP